MFWIPLNSGKEIFVDAEEVNGALAKILSDHKKFKDLNVDKDTLTNILSICLNSAYVNSLIYKMYDDEITDFFSEKYDT